MNPFRSRRKVKEGKEREGKESQDSKDGGSSDSPSSLPTLAKKAKALAKSKRSPSHSRSPSPSAAPSLDLSTALPSDDAFRTSLLMPNLSARFSMLREQDDPASKLGKASDDSVLFPKRQSRLDGFAAAATAGRLPLADIDEVSSAHRDSTASGLESANGTGTGSDTGSGAASESGPPPGSIMDRRRPAESNNNTFSGRQKFYRIPVGAGTAPSGKPRGGKIVYEDDVAMSAFQRHLRDKKRNAAVLESPTSPPADSQSPDSRPNQDGEPKQNGELKQEETVAHPQRDADNSRRCQLEEANRTPSADVDRDNQPPPATAVATGKPDDGPGNEKPSPAPALATPSRGINRERRPLRLDSSSLNSQSPSANTPLSPTRLDSLRRRPALDAGALHRSLSRSATNLHERYQRRPVYAVGNVPPGTPGTPSTPGLPGGSRAASPSSPPLSRSSSLSRPVLPDDREPLAASLRPEDVGKATALGLFNKPVTASKYDEAQFSRRQLQMHQGRITPRSSSEQSSLDLDRSRFNRSRGQSLTKHESASSSARPSLSDDPPPRSPMRTIPQDLTSLMPDGDAGDDDAAAASQIHPAFRSSTPSTESASASRASSLRVSQSSEPRYPESDLNTIDENESLKGPPSPVEECPVEEDHPSQFEDNTPTNPGGVGLGLSSLVNRLRPESQMFEQPSAPAPASSSTLSPPRSLGNNLRNQNTRSIHSVHSNPWELDEYCLDLPPVTATQPPSPSPAKPAAPAPPLTADSLVGMSARAKAMLEQAAALRGEQEQRQQQQQQQQQQRQRSETDSKPPVRRPLQRAPASSSQDYDPASTNSYQHQREISADTQMEREDLAAELAERRRRVQEKLKSFAEAMEGSRSSSPFPSYVEPVSAPAAAPSSGAVTMKANPFALLKHRKRDESRERNRSVSPRQFTPTSTSRVLRLSGVSGEESIGMTSVPSVGAADSSGPGQSQQPMRNRSDSGQLRTRPGRSDSDVSGRSNGNGTAWSVYRASDRDRDQSADRYRLSEEAFRRPGGGGTATTAGSVTSSARPSIDRDNSCSDFSATRRAPLPPVASGTFSYAPGYNGFGPGVNGNISSSYESGVSQTSSGATTTASGLTASSSTDMSSPRPSPNTPFYAANATPPIEHPAPTAAMPVLTPQMTQNSASGSSINLSNGNGSIHRTHTGAGARKRTIDKTQISEPILVSSTNDMPTIGLPPAGLFGSPLTSLPIPPMNPRRRQTTTQAIFGAFRGDYHRGDRDLRVDSGNLPGSGCASPIPPSPSTRSGFFDDDSDDDDDDSGPFGTGSLRGMRSRSRSRSRSRIRKMVTSTVGDNPPPVPVLSRGQVQVHAQMQPQVPIEGDMI